MGFSEEHGLTLAGTSFVLGWMTNRDPSLAAEALEALREYASGNDTPPGYWLRTSEL